MSLKILNSAPLSPHTQASPPSSWVCRHAGLIPGLQQGAQVLDVACGTGRHVRWLTEQGARVTALDRDAVALSGLQGIAAETVLADIEQHAWPLPGRVFDAVVVTHYLWRALFPTLIASVAPGGVLIYETFGHGQASIGKPSRPDFLLQPGELLQVLTPALRIVAYEDGFLSQPPRFVQRVVAVREHPDPGPARYLLPEVATQGT